MKAKRIIALVLSVLALFAFAGCKEEKKDKNNEDLVGFDDTDYTKDLEVADYDGYKFRILIRPGKTPDQYLEEDSDDPVESAVYKRNKTIEGMYNIEIVATESSNTDGETDALNSILAGDDAYDVIFPHTGSAFTYAVQGACVNYNDVSTIHTEKPWWSQDIIDSFDVNGNLYILDGDISMHRLEYAMCMYFNKTIFDELGLDYPYEMVEYGEWTFDEFEEFTKQGGADLNGDGIITPEDDRFGYVSNEWQTPISIIYTGGQRIYTKNEEGIPELTLNSLKTVDIYDSFFGLFDNEACFLQLTTEQHKNYKGPHIFTAGRAMFHDGNLGEAKSFRSMEDDFGILPLPKYEYDEEYATIVNGHAHVMIMPITVEDTEKTGAIIEALCAIGSRDVLPAFYDVSLKTKFARDNESEDMMDIIRESIIYDLGYCSGGTFQSIGRNLAISGNYDFASVYAASESAALMGLRDFNESYGGIEAE